MQSNQNKSIAFFIGKMGRGGAERVISILANEYAQKGYNTHICMLLDNNIEYELNSKIVLHDFSRQDKSRLNNLLFWVSSIRQFFKEIMPDSVVSFVARINVLVLLASFGIKTRITVSERNDPRFDGRGIATRVMTALLYPKADKIVFQTEEVKSLFSKRIQKKSVIIPNPINVNVEAVELQNKIVTVGRLMPQKNHKLLINAFGEFVKQFPDYKLYIYGEGELRQQLEKQITNLNLTDLVFLPGVKANIHEEIKDAYMFVLSSDFEGLSNALLEAMVMGLPCISTDCAGSNEYIKNGENGLIVPVGNKNALVDAMLSFASNEQFRNSCAKKAKEIRNTVGKDCVMKQWNEVIG